MKPLEIPAIRVLCVDDNPFVAEGIKIRLTAHNDGAGFEWLGHLNTADELLSTVANLRPHIVLLDIDMPGRDSLDALEELSAKIPETRTIIVSGYERDDYLDRAVEAGAWGYVSKNDGPQQIVDAIREVHAGRFAFGPSLLRYCGDLSSPIAEPQAAAQ